MVKPFSDTVFSMQAGAMTETPVKTEFGWHVIKVVWGRKWDSLIERDQTGLLQKIMDDVCDGELQNCKFNDNIPNHFHHHIPMFINLLYM